MWLNGHPDRRLPNTLNLSITGVPGDALLAATPELAVSTGSACHSGTTEPSPVLSAMRINRDRALSAVRLTLGRWTTEPEIDRAAELLAATARRARHCGRSGQGRPRRLAGRHLLPTRADDEPFGHGRSCLHRRLMHPDGGQPASRQHHDHAPPLTGSGQATSA